MEKQNYCVYMHISPSCKKYIGITCRNPKKRWNYGKGYVSNDYFTKAIEKYGWNSFDHIILCTGLTREEASNLEILLIEMYDTTNREKGYNLDGGGIKRKRMSEETRRKIGDAHRGKYTEAQWAATRARDGKGHPHSEETKRHLSEVHRGKKMSAEACAKMSESHKGKKPSEKNLELLRRSNMKPVNQYNPCGDYIQTYESIKDAAIANSLKPFNIGQCCLKHIEEYGGYIWEYAV